MRVLADNVCSAWIKLLLGVIESGQVCAPRGKKIRELLHTQVVVTDARNNILAHPMRDLNYRFMVAEWLWIQSGRSDVAWIERFNKNITQFSDDGVNFRGAYGPRFREQVDRVLALLKRDPDSRQAVIRIFDGSDLEGTTKDVPCTLSLQLFLRKGLIDRNPFYFGKSEEAPARLHGIMTMRSNDLWLGFPYDFFNFSQLTNSIAGELGVEVGSFTLQAGSSHVYEENWEKVQEVVALQGPAMAFSFERSPQLKRLAPPAICQQVMAGRGDAGPWMSLDENETMYVHALKVSTKAQALEALKLL